MSKARGCLPLLGLPLLLNPAWAADYVGAEACGKCHAAEFRAQSPSAHAHALAPSTASQPGDWAFGAGAQAITFVSRVDREKYREHGETWYRATDGYAITPGHKNAAGVEFRIFDPAARMLRCFACHSTGPVTLGDEDRIVPHELGVRCEACHGGGALHARDPAHNRVRDRGQMTARALNAFCGECHRLDLETGENLMDVRDARNSRNEPVMLAASECFRKSAGGLSCVRCHSPHAALERTLDAYDAVCRSCHAAPRHSQAVAARKCVECHMPKIPQANLEFTNHRIAAYAAGDPVVPAAGHGR